MIATSPLLVKLCIASVISMAVMFGVGFWQGYEKRDRSAAEETAALNAVAMSTNARYRTLEKEAADAQAGYVEAFKRNRDASAAEWVRIKAAARRDVPAIHAECGGSPADSGTGLEGDRATAREVTDALAVASDLGATLRLCQTELRKCAELTK